MAADLASTGLRIGDAERDRAAEALGAHLRAGRLDPGEYDDRVQAAFRARTAEELTPLFSDLPDGGAPVTAPTRRARRRPVPTVPRAAVLVLVLAAVVAFIVVAHFPPFFLIPLLWFGFGRRGRTPHPGWGNGYRYGHGYRGQRPRL